MDILKQLEAHSTKLMGTDHDDTFEVLAEAEREITRLRRELRTRNIWAGLTFVVLVLAMVLR